MEKLVLQTTVRDKSILGPNPENALNKKLTHHVTPSVSFKIEMLRSKTAGQNNPVHEALQIANRYYCFMLLFTEIFP